MSASTDVSELALRGTGQADRRRMNGIVPCRWHSRAKNPTAPEPCVAGASVSEWGSFSPAALICFYPDGFLSCR